LLTPPASPLTPELLDAAVELMGQSGRHGTVRVTGRSMVPTLEEGFLLAVEFSPSRPKRGDLLVFRRDSLLVVHRLLGRARRRGGPVLLRTRGDGLPHFDPPVESTRVIARVIAVDDGRAWRSFRTPGARLYGWLVAWHDLFWASAISVARLVTDRLARLGLEPPLGDWIAALDRAALRSVHALVFRALHRRTSPPDAAGAE
jgi:hypothetical protein